MLFSIGFVALGCWLTFGVGDTWKIKHIPATYWGWFLGGLGALGLAGVNIFYSGPFDKRLDG